MSKITKYAVIATAVLALVLFSYYRPKKAMEIDYKIKAGKDITIFEATDIHYLAKSLTDGGSAFQQYVEAGDGKQLNYIDEMMSTLSYEIKNTKPEVLIISGDLTNNGEKESHLELSNRLKEIEASGTSVYVIPGNHDILNTYAAGFEGDEQYGAEYISSEEFSSIYKDFGYEEAVLRDKNTLSYLAAPSEDLWLLMLDTSKYKSNLTSPFPQGDGELSKATLNWIKKCSALAKSKGAKLLTIMHHNLIDHNAAINRGYTINNSKEAIERFIKEGLNLVLSGHIHMQDISSYKKGENTIYDIATSSLAVYPNQYGILKYTADASTIDYSTSRLEVEAWAKASGAERKSLYDFKNNAEEFFGQISYDKSYERLLKEGTYSKEDIKLMAETMKILNLRTFSGTEHLNSQDVIDSKGYKLWLASTQSSFGSYIHSMIKDTDSEDNKLQVQLNK
jgi:3',5'-cyclic AMP phosphodiesterase CpdA